MNRHSIIRVGTIVATIALGCLPATSLALPPNQGTLNVSASIAQNCVVTSSANMAFGAYDPITANLTAPLDQSAQFTVTCTNGAQSITMDMGASGNAGHCSATTRCMKNGSHYLDYELYQDNGYSTVWSSGAGTESLSPANWGNAHPDTVTVYGQIPGAQDAYVSSGNYSDTITTTVNF
jgi:spore coat protein U-like protein